MFNISKSIKRLISASAAAACLVTGVQFTPDAIKITADAATKTGMNASQIAQDMKIGWNLGNTLDATGGGAYTGLNTEISWGNPRTTKAMIDTVKAKGFNTVRIPTTWYPHLDGSNNIDSAWMARVKEVVNYCIDNDMYVILNVHHEEWVNVAEFNNQTYQNAETKLKAIWTQVAKEFSDYDQHLVFEGMNEPRQTGLGNSVEWGSGDNNSRSYINKLNAVFVNTVRSQGSSQNKERMLMLPGYCASSDPDAIRAIEIPANAGNVALSVHAYAPYFFTMADDQYANHKYPGASGYGEDYTSSLKTMFGNFKQISNQKGAPIVIGEFGSSNFGNTSDRVAWAKDYIKFAKEAGFPCILWDNNVEGNNGGEAHGYLNRNMGGTSWYSASEAVVDAYINTVNDPSILWDGRPTTTTTTVYDPTTTTTTTAPISDIPADFVAMAEEGDGGVMINVAEFAPRGAKSVTLYVKVKSNDTEVSGGFGTWINSTQTWNQEEFEGAPVGADGIAAIDYKLPAVIGNTVKAMVWWPHAEDAEITNIVLHMNDTPGTTTATTTKTTTTTTTTKGGNNNTTTTTAAPGNGDVEAEFVKSGQEEGDDGEINNFVEFKPDGAKSVSLYIKVNSNDTEVSGGFGTWINSTSSWEQENFEAVKVGSDKVAIVDYNIPAVVGNTIKAMVWWPHGDNAEILKVVLHKDSTSSTTTSKTTTTTTTTKATTTTSKTTTSTTTSKTTTTSTTTNSQPGQVVYGDANCDGNVNIGDAVIILQYHANNDKFGVKGSDPNHITEQGLKNADCSSVGDGVTPMDALAIQKLLLKIYTSLPV